MPCRRRNRTAGPKRAVGIPPTPHKILSPSDIVERELRQGAPRRIDRLRRPASTLPARNGKVHESAGGTQRAVVLTNHKLLPASRRPDVGPAKAAENLR